MMVNFAKSIVLSLEKSGHLNCSAAEATQSLKLGVGARARVLKVRKKAPKPAKQADLIKAAVLKSGGAKLSDLPLPGAAPAAAASDTSSVTSKASTASKASKASKATKEEKAVKRWTDKLLALGVDQDGIDTALESLAGLEGVVASSALKKLHAAKKKEFADAKKLAAKAAKLAEREAAKQEKAFAALRTKAMKLGCSSYNSHEDFSDLTYDALKALMPSIKEEAKAEAKAHKAELRRQAKLAAAETKAVETWKAKVLKVNVAAAVDGLTSSELKALLAVEKESKKLADKEAKAVEAWKAKVLEVNAAAVVDGLTSSELKDLIKAERKAAKSVTAPSSTKKDVELEEEGVEEAELELSDDMKFEHDGTVYYKTEAYGFEHFLFSLEGEAVGIFDPEDGTIQDIEFDE